MIRHILLRVLYTLPAVWLILTMVFLLIHIVPGDPVLQMLGQDARAEDLTLLRHSLGLDQPIRCAIREVSRGSGTWRLGSPRFVLLLLCVPLCWIAFLRLWNCLSRP